MSGTQRCRLFYTQLLPGRASVIADCMTTSRVAFLKPAQPIDRIDPD